MQSPEYEKEKSLKYNIMKKRADKVKAVLAENKHYEDVWTPYPFNSGYFMCVRLKDINAGELRVSLLEKRGIGTISINETDLRIAFSCVEEEHIADLFEEIYQEAKHAETGGNIRLTKRRGHPPFCLYSVTFTFPFTFSRSICLKTAISFANRKVVSATEVFRNPMFVIETYLCAP